MKTTEYYHENSNVVGFKRIVDQEGYWAESTYDTMSKSKICQKS